MLAQAREALEDWSINKAETREVLEELVQALDKSSAHMQRHPKKLVTDVLAEGRANVLAAFLDRCAVMTAMAQKLSAQISGEADEATLDKIRKVEDICARASLSTIDSRNLAKQLETKKKFAGTARAISLALEPLIAACESTRTWLLDDLAKAHALYRAVGREAIVLRSSKLAEDNAAYHLQKLCEEGLQLQRERDALLDRVSLSVEVSHDALVQCVSVLRTAGPLAFLSSSYRNARRLFNSISRLGSYSKDQAIRCLDDLIAFRRKSVEFLKQAEASDLFGMYYRGLDTKYEPFERVAKYFEGLFEHFDKPEHAKFRAFLREATVSQLDLLPALPRIGVPITFVSLRDRIASAESEARLLETAIDELQAVGGVFKNSEIAPSGIQAAKVLLETLLSGRTELDRDEVARELLGQKFTGHRTDVGAYEMIIAWAQSVTAADLTRAVLLRGDPQEARRSIAAVLSAEGNLAATLDRLADTAKIDTASSMRGRTLVEAAAALEKAAIDGDGLFAFRTLCPPSRTFRPMALCRLSRRGSRQARLPAWELRLRRSPSDNWQRRSMRTSATN